MTAQRYKPAPGLVVRDPITGKALAATGARVPDTVYWRRRIAAGDVILVPARRRQKRKRGDNA